MISLNPCGLRATRMVFRPSAADFLARGAGDQARGPARSHQSAALVNEEWAIGSLVLLAAWTSRAEDVTPGLSRVDGRCCDARPIHHAHRSVVRSIQNKQISLISDSKSQPTLNRHSLLYARNSTSTGERLMSIHSSVSFTSITTPHPHSHTYSFRYPTSGLASTRQPRRPASGPAALHHVAATRKCKVPFDLDHRLQAVRLAPRRRHPTQHQFRRCPRSYSDGQQQCYLDKLHDDDGLDHPFSHSRRSFSHPYFAGPHSCTQLDDHRRERERQ